MLLNVNSSVSLTFARYFSQRSVDTYFPIFLSSLTWSSISGLGTSKNKQRIKTILAQKIKNLLIKLKEESMIRQNSCMSARKSDSGDPPLVKHSID